MLAPLLFLYFINDLPDHITSSVRLYTDDAILNRTIHSEEHCHCLQQDLHTLEEWATKWDMLFNIQKCEFLRITNKTNFVHFLHTLHNEFIYEVSHVKYFATIINSKLSWSKHIQEIATKAYKVKDFLQRNLHSCPMSVKAKCYKSLVKPLLEYACVAWAPHTQRDISSIESLQRRAARFNSSVTEMM